MQDYPRGSRRGWQTEENPAEVRQTFGSEEGVMRNIKIFIAAISTALVLVQPATATTGARARCAPGLWKTIVVQEP